MAIKITSYTTTITRALLLLLTRPRGYGTSTTLQLTPRLHEMKESSEYPPAKDIPATTLLTCPSWLRLHVSPSSRQLVVV
jgi:hypothetical protein